MVRYNPKLGLLLSLVTAIFWGSLPIAMKEVVMVMPPITAIWYRFVAASIGLGIILAIRHRLPNLSILVCKRNILLVIVAIVGLGGNFLLFSSSLKYLSPTAVQVLAQLSPIGMLMAGFLFFREKVFISQIIGAVMVTAGLLLFFNQNWHDLLITHYSRNTIGILLGVSAAFIWVMYGVAQKFLLGIMQSQQILFILYTACAVLIYPVAKPADILSLDNWQLGCLIYCCINTLIAYGAFVQAMAVWRVSYVSAIVALGPLFTLLFSDILATLYPESFTLPALNWIGYLGALVVIMGVFLIVGYKLIFSSGKSFLYDKQDSDKVGGESR